MGYMCMLCVTYIKARILFALEKHSTINIICNLISFNVSDMIIDLHFLLSLSCYAFDLLTRNRKVKRKFLFSMHAIATRYSGFGRPVLLKSQ